MIDELHSLFGFCKLILLCLHVGGRGGGIIYLIILGCTYVCMYSILRITGSPFPPLSV